MILTCEIKLICRVIKANYLSILWLTVNRDVACHQGLLAQNELLASFL